MNFSRRGILGSLLGAAVAPAAVKAALSEPVTPKLEMKVAHGQLPRLTPITMGLTTCTVSGTVCFDFADTWTFRHE